MGRSNLAENGDAPRDFMAINSYLMEIEQEYYFYLPRSRQPFRVVLRHLHHTTPTTDIINCLDDLGHKVISITNITHSTNKLPLPLFNIILVRNNNNHEIFKITKLLNSIIKFEYTKRQLGPPECHHCQKYGHTRNYCHRNPRCVKCGAEHFTENCT
uniref:Nucleic-acid-binding protein from transposon X-element n=1 Tax=Melanaphis sacchari TaxID=742174 RepID=A0A2H8TR91_9HEMI